MNGTGYYDEDGAWIVGEDDLSAPGGMFSEFLNKITRSVKESARSIAVDTLASDPAPAAAAATAVAGALQNSGLVNKRDEIVFHRMSRASGYLFAVVTSSRRRLLAITRDGFIEGKFRMQANSVPRSALDADARAVLFNKLPRSSPYLFAILSASRRRLLSIDRDGTVRGKIEPGAGLVGPAALNPVLAARFGSVGSPVTVAVPAGGAYDVTQIAAEVKAGDSLTAGDGGGTPVPDQLAAILGRPVQNFGVGGMTSTEVRFRLGQLTLALTLPANTIPATTATVAATAYAPTTSWRELARSYPAVVTTPSGEVPVVVAWDGTSWTLARTTAGAEVVLTGPAKVRCTAADAYKGRTLGLWAGQNNKVVRSTVAWADVVPDILASVKWVTALTQRWYVLGVPVMTNEPAGSAGAARVAAANDALEAALGGDHFYRIWDDFVTRGAELAGIAEDATARTNRVPQPALMADTIHPNADGKRVLALLEASFILQKGLVQ